jgi:hypothetical protein
MLCTKVQVALDRRDLNILKGRTWGEATLPTTRLVGMQVRIDLLDREWYRVGSTTYQTGTVVLIQGAAVWSNSQRDNGCASVVPTPALRTLLVEEW